APEGRQARGAVPKRDQRLAAVRRRRGRFGHRSESSGGVRSGHRSLGRAAMATLGAGHRDVIRRPPLGHPTVTGPWLGRSTVPQQDRPAAEENHVASVTFEHVSKRFGEVTAVDDLDLEVVDGEFMVLLGPSGCGKTTALRMIAGLETITEGTLLIGADVVND